MWQAPKRLAGSTLRDGVLSVLLWIWVCLLLLPLCAAAKLPNPYPFLFDAGVLFAVAWLIPSRLLQTLAGLLVTAFTAHSFFYAEQPFWSENWVLRFVHLLQSGKLAVVGGQLQDMPTVTMVFLLVIWGAVYLYRLAVGSRVMRFALWVIGLLAIGIEDSFTPADGHLYMACYFIVGLLLLALCQVPNLEKTIRPGQRRAGWPLPFVIGTLAIAVCTTAVGAAAPKLRSQWPDPVPFLKSYTNPRGAGSSELKKIGYTSDDTLLGGSFSADNALAMVAISDQKGYWRGETRTLYTGKGWTVSADSLPVPANVNGETSLSGFAQLNVLAGFANPKVKVKKVVQSVSIVDGNPSVFFSQYELTGLTLTGDTAGSMLTDHPLFWSKRSGYVRSDIVKSGSTYTAVSDVPYIDKSLFNELFAADPHYKAAVLKNLASMSSAFTTATTLGSIAAGVSDPFLLTFSSELTIPDSFPQRDRDLAAKIVAGQTTDYDKAKAIESYLRANYDYQTKQIPTPGPQDDFVDQFLFDTKRGYCDHFSSAMVLLARCAGLPARWVTGYAAGTVDPSYQDPSDPHKMRFLIHNSDAHSWAEVYLRGVGWIPFEATPSFTLPQPQADSAPQPGQDPVPLPPVQTGPAPDQSANATPAQLPNTAAHSNWNWSYLRWPGLLLAALGLIASLLFWRRLYLSYQLRPASGSADEVILGLMGRLISVLQRRGPNMGKHLTIREYLPQAEAKLGKDWVAFARLYEQVRYGKLQTQDQQNADEARELFRRILSTLLYTRKKR